MASEKPVLSPKKLLQRSKTLRLVSDQLKESEVFSIEPELVEELEGYLERSPLIPRFLDATQEKTVRRAQRTLHNLDGLLSRVAAVQFQVAKVLKTLRRLEILVRRELLRRGYLNDRMTKHAGTDRLALVFPLLVQYQNDWGALEKLCTLVQNRFSDSKDSLKLQMRLDDNARWAAKVEQ